MFPQCPSCPEARLFDTMQRPFFIQILAFKLPVDLFAARQPDSRATIRLVRTRKQGGGLLGHSVPLQRW